MYRLIPAQKDTYITNKYIENSRSIDANTGQAGTIDMFALKNETTVVGLSGSIFELSRGLIKFDYSVFSNSIDISSPNFTASVILKNVYGGQTVPSNFTLALYPLSKSFDEGRGFDVASYKDIDTANFLKCSSNTFWTVSGANATGSLGEDIDIIISGNIGSGVEGLGSYCSFERGDEDARFNITKIVSASLAGILENNGFRLSFITQEEDDSTTRFVKRFGSRHSLNKEKRPKLIIEDSKRIFDTTNIATFGISQSFYTYNFSQNNSSNFISASSQITGSDCLILELISSKSVVYYTSSYQENFLQTITHKTSSVLYYSRSFSGSQYNNDTGVYYSEFILDPTTDSELTSFISNKDEINFQTFWKSNDQTVIFSKQYVKFKTYSGAFTNIEDKNIILNVINLQKNYSKTQEARLKVFIQDRTNSVSVKKVPEQNKSVVFSDLRWRLKKPYSKIIVVPFSESTRLSSDSDGMYFDLYMEDLDLNEVYEIEFVAKNSQNKDILFTNKGFTFKVIE